MKGKASRLPLEYLERFEQRLYVGLSGGTNMKAHNLGETKLGILLLLLAPLLMGTTWAAIPLEEVADTMVLLIPHNEMALHVPMPTERAIQGKIVKVEKGQLLPQAQIIHTANTFTTPLKQGIPYRLFLKKFPDRDAYYIIGVLPMRQGGGK